MALTTVRGYYRNGRIELVEQPEGIQEEELKNRKCLLSHAPKGEVSAQ